MRVISFATHGLLASELGVIGEPALVLYQPKEVRPGDDGLLLASEVAQLRLAADWVILSACNTASAEGNPGAEGLSGLARAFFLPVRARFWSVTGGSTRKALRFLLHAPWKSGAATQLPARRKLFAKQCEISLDRDLLERIPSFGHPLPSLVDE